jgi:uncharacterized glyoxalase superfamily protein PhnB
VKRSPVTVSLFAPQLPDTVEYYAETLGFRKTGSYEEPDGTEIWAEVALDDARIWFFSYPIDRRHEPVLTGLIYVFVDNVDEVANRLAGKVQFEWGPQTQEYGLRELGVKDLNGYHLVFAQDV